MLVLSRNVYQAIIIKDYITIGVMSDKGKQVRIGIEAPESVSVHREEVYEVMEDEAVADVNNN